MLRPLLLVLAPVALAACGPRETELEGGPSDGAVLEGGDSSEAAGGPAAVELPDKPPCALFTSTEIGAFLGKPVKEGESAAAGTGCHWVARDGQGDVIVQVTARDRFSPPVRGADYEELADVGESGYAVRELGGHSAGAIDGDKAVMVSMDGPLDSRDLAVDLLKQALKRNP